MSFFCLLLILESWIFKALLFLIIIWYNLTYSKATLATISYSIENGKLNISFSDNGTPYNPLEAAEPDTTLSAEEREIGGLGIFMVKKMTESMEYEYKDDKNVLTLVVLLS